MATFDLKTGHRYRAELSLGLLEQLADNEMIASQLRRVGFSEVHVQGDGAARHAEGTWQQPSNTVPLPPQVVSIREIQDPQSVA